jgi:DNA-binding response OmpR family regulator
MTRLRVLVVEDDPMVGPLLAEVLEDLGHVVVAVEADADAAVARARALLRNLELGPGAVLIQKPYRRHDIVAAIARVTGDAAKRDEAVLV